MLSWPSSRCSAIACRHSWDADLLPIRSDPMKALFPCLRSCLRLRRQHQPPSELQIDDADAWQAVCKDGVRVRAVSDEDLRGSSRCGHMDE